MKIFVTGGTGFIGVPLIKQLVSRGHSVVVLARNIERAKNELGLKIANELMGKISFFAGDLSAEHRLIDGMKGCEAVFNVAGTISYRNCDRTLVRETNVRGTANVLSAAKKNRVQRLVHTSSIVAVGITWSENQVLDESAEYNAANLDLEYFNTKHQGEMEVIKSVRDGLDAVIVNPGAVAGFSDDSGRNGNIGSALKMLAIVPFLLPGGNSWVDVRDVVAGHIAALEKGETGERYILAAENISNAEVTKRIRSARGKKVPSFELPQKWVRILSYFPLIDQLAIRNCGFYLYFNSKKAKERLGLTFRSPWPAMQAMLVDKAESIKTGRNAIG